MEKEILKNKILPSILIFLLFFSYFLILASPIDFVVADLGRHIKNGEYILKNFEIIRTNFYSYTYSEFNTTNHHWLGGVIFYSIFYLFDFFGVHLFFIFLSLLTLFIFYKTATRNSNRSLALLVGFLILPLLLQRREVRPEIFTCLFSGIFFLFLSKYRAREINFKKLIFILLPLQILWANLHIYFFLGPVIAGVFFLEFVIKKNYEEMKKLLLMACMLFAISILNPFGFAGLFAPFNIFSNYGYRLIENQSIWFLLKIFPQINLFIFMFIFSIISLSFVFVFLNNKKSFDWALFLLFFGFSGMAWLMLRNFTLFGFFSLIFLSYNFSFIIKKIKSNELKYSGILFFILFLTLITLLIILFSKILFFGTSIHIGLNENIYDSINFFKDNGLQGPIFNNYDIGGYLIFNFYPQERVFVDNRPEAYPSEFFEQIYIPMQENETTWNENLKKYSFNVIFFSHRDLTPWSQNFLINRILDEDWAVVYVDESIIIFLYRNEKNEEVISRFEISNSFFGL